MHGVVQASSDAAGMPSEAVLALHNRREIYDDFEAFQPRLAALLHEGSQLDDAIELTRTLGILEPFTRAHIPAEAIEIQGPNYRESLIANGLPSRNRAVLVVLEMLYGSLQELGKLDVYLVEALTGFAAWLKQQVGNGRLTCSEYLEDAELSCEEITHQDLCALSFAKASFDLVICNELFEHVQDLDLACREVARVLKGGGRLVATCPLAFGQKQSIMKAIYDASTGSSKLLMEAERHGDPVRPESGSLVYRIPGWEVLEQLQRAGFSKARMHHITSWKHGVLGSDLPGVLVIDAER